MAPSSGQDDEIKRKILIKLDLEMQEPKRAISELSQCELQHDELIISCFFFLPNSQQSKQTKE